MRPFHSLVTWFSKSSVQNVSWRHAISVFCARIHANILLLFILSRIPLTLRENFVRMIWHPTVKYWGDDNTGHPHPRSTPMLLVMTNFFISCNKVHIIFFSTKFLNGMWRMFVFYHAADELIMTSRMWEAKRQDLSIVLQLSRPLSMGIRGDGGLQPLNFCSNSHFRAKNR